jgi:hypothetical protein
MNESDTALLFCKTSANMKMELQSIVNDSFKFLENDLILLVNEISQAQFR